MTAARQAPRAKPSAAGQGRSAQHTSAIHTLAARLGLSDSARRDVMQAVAGKRSCTDMTLAERALVREHLARQLDRQGLGATQQPTGRTQRMTPAEFARAKQAASPRERKLWALWHELHRAGLVDRADRAALDAWVHGQVQVSAPRFCTAAQLDTCIEAAKAWLKRGPGAAPPA